MDWRLLNLGTQRLARAIFALEDDDDTTAVIASRPVSELPAVQEQVVQADAKVADLLLRFVRETAAARNEYYRLLEVISDFAFQAFPGATHHVLVVREEADGELRSLVARSRSGDEPRVALSRTIVNKVMNEGVALLFSRGQIATASIQSVELSKLQTAICAPLIRPTGPFGVIQVDIRRPATGVFRREDVDLLSVFASQVSLAIDHLRLFHQQRRAFQSTINALVHSLTLKDPETAHHSERVQAVALEIGREMSLGDRDMEVLSVAALLHDLGKQGVRDEVLFKPDRLTPEERAEMNAHATHTQNILDMIEYPEPLKDVPRIAAYHHEKMNGSGPFKVKGEDIPLVSRIISVADVFDALMSPRVYKQPLKPSRVLGILDHGKGADWDPVVIDALRRAMAALQESVYQDASRSEVKPGDAEGLERAA
jgi:putative nucleotidyltransferase with HDIG domain